MCHCSHHILASLKPVVKLTNSCLNSQCAFRKTGHEVVQWYTNSFLIMEKKNETKIKPNGFSSKRQNSWEFGCHILSTLTGSPQMTYPMEGKWLTSGPNSAAQILRCILQWLSRLGTHQFSKTFLLHQQNCIGIQCCSRKEGNNLGWRMSRQLLDFP